MSFFDIFKRKPVQAFLSLTPKGINLKGTRITLPANINSLKALLGEPRVTVYEPNDIGVPANINYTWDEQGIYCYTKGGENVHAIGIQISTGGFKLKHTPTKCCREKIMINGIDWLDAMRNGERCKLDEGTEFEIEIFRRVWSGKYSAVSEFSEEGSGKDSKPDDFSMIEIQIDA